MKTAKLGLLSAGLIFGLSACNLIPGTGGGPRIISFSADPPTVAAGEPSVLSWSVDSSADSVSISGAPAITGDSGTVTVTPTVTTEYTLTARSSEGSSTRTVTVTVSDGNGGSGGNGGGNGGTGSRPILGVSTSATGPFESDVDGTIASDDDPRIISVAAGSTFYAQVVYESATGIGSLNLRVVNSSPTGFAANLPTDDFTVGTPTGECDTGPTVTSVDCVYPITVAPGTPDIENVPDAGGEFAYVFRVVITDGAGADAPISTRGYVNID